MLLTTSWVVDVLIFSIGLILVLYKYCTRNFNYWKSRGVKYIKPIPFFGNAFDVCTGRISARQCFKDFYDSIDAPYFGIFVFDEPSLVIKSPQLIKQILIKDFDSFDSRKILAPKHNEIGANVMFSQKNPDWKMTRSKITPVFTPAKLKGMCALVNSIGETMTDFIGRHTDQQQDATDLCARFTTDVITKCAFAIDARSFGDVESDFRKIGKGFFQFKWQTVLRQGVYVFLPNLAQRLRVEFVDPGLLKYLSDMFWDAIQYREETKAKAHDLIDIIVKIRKDEEFCKELGFEGDKVVAQAVMFFSAGFETTAAIMAFTLYEVCINPKIQERLRDEITESIKQNGSVTYDSLMEMKYLDMCLNETLRKYPVLPFLDRTCNKDYKIPGTDLVIEKGMTVYVPLLGLQKDEKYFPDPEKYDPERFQGKTVYNEDGITYMPFGEGPRNCIGARFGKLAAKLGVVHILSQYILEKSEDTPIPVEYQKQIFGISSKVGLPMRFRKVVC